MRFWSIHPSYLDGKGLVALWRETLLAQKVLRGETVGYKNHPQLIRFKNTSTPTRAIARYLIEVAKEADLRNYNFDTTKILAPPSSKTIQVTSGQLKYELDHLINKLQQRNPSHLKTISQKKKILPHPQFTCIGGEREDWEKSVVK